MDAATFREFTSNPVVVVGGCLAFTRTEFSCSPSEIFDFRGRCQTAVTPILSAADSHLLFLPAGSCRRVDRLGGIGGLAQANRHKTNPSRIRVHHIGVSDTVSLDGGQAASEGRSESAPFRPDLATQQENHLLESTGWET